MNSIAFIVLALVSLYVFFKLGKVRASNKQLNRNNRINRINRFGQSNKSNIYEGEAKEIHEDKKEDKDN